MRQFRAALAQQKRRQRDRRDPHRNVDEEDPRPAEVRREQAAQQDARRRTAARSRTVDAEREVALAALRECRHQERERRGSEQCPAEPLQPAECDQRPLGPGEAAQQRARGEQRQAGDEEPSAPEQIGDPAAEQQRPAEENRVGGDHPLQVRLREAEIRLDRRQRDVHDRDVENDHELGGDDERQCTPAPFVLRDFSHVLVLPHR